MAVVGSKALFPFGEMSLKLLGVFLLHGDHKGENLLSKDTVSMDSSVEPSFVISIVSGSLLSSMTSILAYWLPGNLWSYV